MDFLPYTQQYIMIISILGGVFLGFIWDMYRLVRHYTPVGKTWTAIGDIIYWIISIKLSIELIFMISYGNIRWFILIGFVVGAVIYFCGLSLYILKILIFLIDTILNLINKTVNVFLFPIKLIKRKIVVFMEPYRMKMNKKLLMVKRRYKFFKFKIKSVSKRKKKLYNKKINKRIKKTKGALNHGKESKDNAIRKSGR